MPIFWSSDELKYLQGSYLLEQIEERNSAIKNDYNEICKLDPTFRDIVTLQEFKWARMCVCSRNFGLNINGLRTAALVPYADMLNHYRPRETKWQFDDSLQGFTITAIQHINDGLQIYDSYGQKCNHRFLLNYGFSVENNVEPDGFNPNEVPILLQLALDDPLYDKKAVLWRKEWSQPSRRLRISMNDTEGSRNMFALLRLIHADELDLEALTSPPLLDAERSAFRNTGLYQRPSLYNPLGVANEIRALIGLRSQLEDMLAAYATSYAEDCARLAAVPPRPEPFSNERHALIQVRGEKQVLLFYSELVDTALELSRVREVDWDATLAEAVQGRPEALSAYCRGVLGRARQEDQRRLEARQRSMDYSRPTAV